MADAFVIEDWIPFLVLAACFLPLIGIIVVYRWIEWSAMREWQRGSGE